MVLKAYLDDSGDGDSKTDHHLTIGGFLSDEDGWARFEPLWDAALTQAKVPYFHLKEFGHKESVIYGHLKRDPDREREFIQNLIRIIWENAPISVAATVPLRTLRQFNAQHKLALDPYALCLYGCVLQIHQVCSAAADVIIDKFYRHAHRAAIARDYCEADHFIGPDADKFTIIPLAKKDSWRDILPLQASDFCAGEVRRFRDARRSWKPTAEIRNDRDLIILSYRKWAKENNPRTRGSFGMLLHSALYKPQHLLLDEEHLEEVHKRHPKGWVVS
jgi:hypothetical protein